MYFKENKQQENYCNYLPSGFLIGGSFGEYNEFFFKNNLALYIGGMGAAKRNFHTELMGRMGFESEAKNIQKLFLEGKRTEAAIAVPDKFADEISLVGTPERIKDRLEAWKETPITSILVATHSPEKLREIAELVLN